MQPFFHFSAGVTKRMLLACLTCLALVACSHQSDPAPERPIDVVVPVEKSTAAVEVQYAKVATLRLKDLELPQGVTTEQVQVIDGKAQDLIVRNGQIRFITPSDTGTDSAVRLRVTPTAGPSIIVPITVSSARPVKAIPEIDADEKGVAMAEADHPILIMTGLGPDNSILGTDIRLSVGGKGAPPLSIQSAANIYVPSTRQFFYMAQYWKLEEATNTLVVPAAKVAQMLTDIPSGEFELDIGLSSEDASFGAAWSMRGHKPTATITLQFVGFDRQPSTLAKGKTVGIVGKDTGARFTAVVDANGRITTPLLGAGMYQITVLDVNAPGFWTMAVPVYPKSTQVQATFVYQPPQAPLPGASAPASANKPQAIRGSAGAITQDGPSPISRISPDVQSTPSMQALAATPFTCMSSGSNGATLYTVVSAQDSLPNFCYVTHTVPKGAEKIGVKLSIKTQEFPSFTGTKSLFNDAWSYAVMGLPDVGEANARVNDSHDTKAEVVVNKCVDVKELAAQEAFDFTANLIATNIGDARFPTTVQMTVKPTCDNELTVTQANFELVNTQGYRVIRQLSLKDSPNYLSLPIQSESSAWGMPLKVNYEPADMPINRVRMGVVVNGAAVMSDTDLSTQISSRSPGELVFRNVLIPRLPITPTTGPLNVVIELRGKKDEVELTSVAIDGRVLAQDNAQFTPLFNAGELFPAARRYGQELQDAGGDAWATFSTIGWLQARPFRFNDISALHIAQTATGRSVLDHAGHNNGAQIDLRYADGAGGYSEQLGGSADGSFIKKMLEDARKEVEAGSTGAKPNLLKANQWITANRQMLMSVAAEAKKLHAGPEWMDLALRKGEFTNGVKIPTVTPEGVVGAALGPWANMPSKLTFIPPHSHHWHITLQTGS
jgi:hypothetical protein